MKIVRSRIGLTLLIEKSPGHYSAAIFTTDHPLIFVPWWSDILFFEEHVNHIPSKPLAGNASF